MATDPIVLYAKERAAALQDAAAFGSSAMVEELCNSPRIHMYIDEALGEAQATALMCAAQAGNLGAVEALLDKHADVDLLDNFGRTALMFASANGETTVVSKLVERGANLGLKAENGWTALMFACACGHHEAAGKLLDSTGGSSMTSPPKQSTMELQSALGLAKEHGQPGSVALLEALLDEEEPVDTEVALMKAAEVWRAGGRTPRVEMTVDDALPVAPATPRGGGSITPRYASVQ